MWLIIQEYKLMNNFKYLLVGLAIFNFISCQNKPSLQSEYVEGNALGTSYHINFYSEKSENWEQGFDSIFEVVNKSMSTYLPNSDISKINKGNKDVEVDQMFREVFDLSKEIYANTDGYFDPTVGNLVNAYGFGAEELNELTEKDLDSLVSLVGFKDFYLTEENQVKKPHKNSYLEFNAIAKGYTVDRLAIYLESQGVENYLVELGGELRAKGINLTKDKSWKVGLDDPYQEDGTREIIAILELNDRALATSGNYRKFRIDSVTGQKFVHTINPKTGKAERSNILSASVLAETCAEADAYATGFMAMGLEKSKKVLQDLDRVEAYLIYTENDSTKIFTTPKFNESLVED